MKKTIMIVILMAIVALVMAKDKLIELSAEKACSFVLGSKLDIGSMRVGILRPVIDIKKMRLYNPKEFPVKLMADIPEIYVRYELAGIFKGNVHIRELRFNLKEFNIVKNSNGVVNLDSLKPVSDKEDGQRIEQEEKGELPDIRIDTLYLKAGEVVYTDYSRSAEDPAITRFNVNIDERFENIEDPYTLVRLIIYRVLMNTTVSNLVDVPMQGVKDIADKAYKVGTAAVETATGTAKTMASGTQTVMKGAGDTMQKAAGTIGGFFTAPSSKTGQATDEKAK
jgi:uncharacterized protein involved in outer membrane biogenesis